MKAWLLLGIAAVALATDAQYDWQGRWFARITIGNTLPALNPGEYPAFASAYDSVFVLGGKDNVTYRYDHYQGHWTQLPTPTPNNLAYRAASMIYAAGNLVLFGGHTLTSFDNTMYTLSTVSPGKSWTPRVTVGDSPPARNAHTLTAANGKVYVIGGWNEHMYFNGVWASDLSELVNPGAPTASWLQVIPETTSTDLFHSRNSHTVNVYENRMYLFGGFWHDVSQGSYVQCLPQNQCTWFNDLWVWTVPTGPPAAIAPTSWSKITPASATSPPARAGHAAAFVENGMLMVYGGSNAQGVLSDLWMFLEHKQTWTSLTPVGGSPPPLTTPVGVNIGRHFIVYGGGNTVYDYTPYVFDPSSFVVPTPYPVPEAVDDCARHKDVQGINAGLVIAILIGIVQLVFVILTWRHGGGGFSCAAGGSKGASPYAAMSS